MTRSVRPHFFPFNHGTPYWPENIWLNFPIGEPWQLISLPEQYVTEDETGQIMKLLKELTSEIMTQNIGAKRAT